MPRQSPKSVGATVEVGGFNIQGVKSRDMFTLQNVFPCACNVVSCRALLNLPITIPAATILARPIPTAIPGNRPATVNNVAPGSYDYTYQVGNHVIAHSDPKIIVGS